MNLKSNLLKLSIIFMLILVLIPVASAMDSNETFYIEYDDSGYEEVVDEFEVEDTSDVHSHEENVETSHAFNKDSNDDSGEVSNYNDIVNDQEEIFQVNNVEENKECIIPELNEDDIDVSAVDIEVFESKLVYDSVIEDFDNLTDDFKETDEFEENSVNKDLFLICEFEHKIDFSLIDVYYNEISNFESPFNQNGDFLTKIFELKEKLLLKYDIKSFLGNNINEVKEIVCFNKITTDFAYCIDNSIVGSDSALNLLSCFSNFKSYFSTIFLIFGDIFEGC